MRPNWMAMSSPSRVVMSKVAAPSPVRLLKKLRVISPGNSWVTMKMTPKTRLAAKYHGRKRMSAHVLVRWWSSG